MLIGEGEQFHSIRLPPNILEINYISHRLVQKWVRSVIGKVVRECKSLLLTTSGTFDLVASHLLLTKRRRYFLH
jgi:hypothetical protein